MAGRYLAALELDEAERSELKSLASRRSTAQALASSGSNNLGLCGRPAEQGGGGASPKVELETDRSKVSVHEDNWQG